MTRALKTYDTQIGGPSQPELTRFIEHKIAPILMRAKTDSALHPDKSKKIVAPFMIGMVSFMAIFGLVNLALPNTFFGEALSIIAFPILFLAVMALTLFLSRHRIAEVLLATRDNFLIRSEALTALSKEMGLAYIPIPGGPSETIKAFARWRYCPQLLKDFAELMDDHGGFDDVSDTIRQSGLAVPREAILASDKNKANIYQRQVGAAQFEDGIKGEINGIAFSALEWTESQDESTRHHLLIVLQLPTTLAGRVEFKNKAGKWPVKSPDYKGKPVSLISKAFAKQYQVRASDQMEGRLIFDPAVIEKLTAFTSTDEICGVAFESHLVVDLIGRNRFDILDVVTGEWSEDSIQTTLDDFNEVIDFAATVSRTFSVKPLSRSA